MPAEFASNGLNQGLWLDEILSLHYAFSLPWRLLFTIPYPQILIPHPLYSLLTKPCLLLLGESEWAIRLPAWLAGTLSVPALFWLGDRFCGRRVGAAAALFLGLNLWSVWFSQDARGYSLMMFFSVLAWAGFLRLTDRITWWRGLAYLVATVAAAYSHPYAFAVPAGHLLIALVLAAKKPATTRQAELALAGIILAALLLALALYAPMAEGLLEGSGTVGKVTRDRAFTASFLGNLFLAWSAGIEHPFLSAPLLAAAGVGLIFLAREKTLLGVSWLIPLVIGWIAPLVSGTVVYHRFYLYALPGFLLAAGYDLDAVFRRWTHSRWMRALSLALCLSALLPSLASDYRWGKQGLKPAAEWLRQVTPGAKVFALGLAGPEFRYYYPDAVAVDPHQPLEFSQLDQAMVVVTHPWSVGRQNLETLGQTCGKPRVFPAAGYEENVVLLYQCP